MPTIPASFEAINSYNSKLSVAGTVANDETTRYYMRSLYQRLLSGARFKLPKAWSQGVRYFKNVLYSNGYIGIIKTEEYGVIPQLCTPSGYGLFLQPTRLIVAQPFVNFEGKIGEDCEVIHLTGDWCGVWDIIEHYAVRLAVAMTSVDVGLLNSRVALLAAAKNKSAKATLDILYQKIAAGETFVTYDKEGVLTDDSINGDEDPIWTFALDVKNNYVVDKLLENVETILHQFDAEVGILSGTIKKERMLTDEVQSNNDDACARATTWFNELSDSFDRVNALFPELKLSFTLKYGGETNEYRNENDPNRNV